jgi:hypothetical protein
MNVLRFTLIALSLGGLPAAAAETAAATVPARAAAVAPAPSRSDSSIAPSASFDAFRLITDRNIFNPNRTGRRDRTTEEQPPRVDVLTLVGTMDSDRGLRAFFDGSDATLRKALRVGETVDKFKVASIAPNVVALERDGKTTSMRVGQQLRRPEGADWNLIGEDAARRESQSKAAVDARIDPTAAPVIPANVDDVTRRLMERRAKELKQ